MNEALQTLYDQFHADMLRELVDAEDTSGVDSQRHYAAANAYTNARDAVMRATFYTLEPAK